MEGMPVGKMTLDGVEYVVIPLSEYTRLTGEEMGPVDAIEYARQSLAAKLQGARAHAGLSQAELGAKVGKSQSAVYYLETGKTPASEDYVRAVLKACKLPMNWKAPAAKKG